jgi:Na+-translocating ferredoxin:NAD+ oxidoreductase RnfG subunit
MGNSLRYLTSPVALVCFAVAPCYATDYMTIEEAQRLCFPSATEFQVAHVVFTDEQKGRIEQQIGARVGIRAQKIWRVSGEGGKSLGWFVVDYVIGKHLLIDYAVAIDSNRTVRNVEILSYRESYGGEIRSEAWRKQFEGKTKSSRLELNEDITNIGGATLSARHVTEGVKRVLAVIDVTQ